MKRKDGAGKREEGDVEEKLKADADARKKQDKEEAAEKEATRKKARISFIRHTVGMRNEKEFMLRRRVDSVPVLGDWKHSIEFIIDMSIYATKFFTFQ